MEMGNQVQIVWLSLDTSLNTSQTYQFIRDCHVY